MKSAAMFANFLNESDSTENLVVDQVEPIVVERDTALYIVNNKNKKGWYIIAGDKRAQNIIAYGKKGSFDPKTKNKGVQVWLASTADDIVYLKKNGKPSTKSNNYDIWRMIETKRAPKDAAGNGIVTKANIPNNDELENGHWEVLNENTKTTDLITVPHLLRMAWGQNHPWNQYSQYYILDPTVRCVTGCTAVAGAQAIYALHYKFGQSLYCPSQANLSGRVYEFSSPSQTIWNEMARHDIQYEPDESIEGTDKSSLLIGYIAKNINTEWGVNSSSSNLSNLSDFIRREYSLNCTHQNYDYTNVISNLDQGLPVIVGAHSGIHHTPVGVYYDYSHAWNIDGYSTVTKINTCKYIWTCYGKYFNGKTETVVTTTTDRYLLMNWGYSIPDDAYYSLTGESGTGAWYPDQNSGIDYKWERQTISNFSPM